MNWIEIIELIRRAQTGDRQAFGELVDRFHSAVYAVALARLRNANEAMELTQEVFVHAMTRLDQLRDPHCFTGWLRQITVRMAINRLVRRSPVQNAEPEHVAKRDGPERFAAGRDGPRRAEGRVARKPGQAQADRPRHAGGFLPAGRSLKQMSQEFETPVGTIKRRLHTARERLREQMERSELLAV